MAIRVLILANNEICYNPRLLKAADYLFSKGCDVTVFNPITGIASEKVYSDTLKNRKWKVIAFDMSKRDFSSKLNWIYVSVLHKFFHIFWKSFRIKIGFNYYMVKGLLGAKFNSEQKFDHILIHMVDLLPYAVTLKKRYKAKLIYDSQEYFAGQYNKYAKHLRDWVIEAERSNIKEVDILLATTNAMKERIKKDHNLAIPSFRVRNTPFSTQIPNTKSVSSVNELKLVWHGMTIYLNNTRGVHILIQALAKCKCKAVLYLQGLINDEQQQILNDYIKNLKLENRIIILPPADPDNIVNSLTGYDIGLIGELPQEENQMLTSSNKLFDFIDAGLAVVTPDLTGLNETLNEFNVGIKYPASDIERLAQIIDQLSEDRDLLNELKKNSAEASKQLYWEKDYELVWQEISL